MGKEEGARRGPHSSSLGTACPWCRVPRSRAWVSHVAQVGALSSTFEARSRSRTASQSPSADWGLGGQSMLEGIDTRCTVERAHGASSSCPGCTCGATLARARKVHVPPYASLECAFHRGARRTVHRRKYPKRTLHGARCTALTRNAHERNVQRGPLGGRFLSTWKNQRKRQLKTNRIRITFRI